MKSAVWLVVSRVGVALAVGVVLAAGLGAIEATPAFAATSFTEPATNPFTVPEVQSGSQAGTPVTFPVSGTGYLTNQQVSIEICDGNNAATFPGWDPTVNCDLATSPAPSTAAPTTGNVSWPATNAGNGIVDFRGESPQQVFNCVAPEDIPAGTPKNADGSYTLTAATTANGEPLAPGVESWTNCQLRMSSSNQVVTTDQQFITLTIPDTPTATAQITLAASPPSPQSAGTAITLSAAVTGSGPQPAGTVTFFDGSQPILGCSQVTLALPTTPCTWEPTAGGIHSLSATYNAVSPYGNVTSTAIPYTINAVGPTATVVLTASLPSPQNADIPINLAASVTGSGPPPTGTVTFSDGTQPIAGCSAVALSSPTLCTWTPTSAGVHSLTATYNGDTNYLVRATSAPPLSYTINPPGPAITTPTANPFAIPESSGETGQPPKGTPLPFAVSGTRYAAGQQVSIEICDGTPPGTPNWAPNTNCDPSTAPFAQVASAGSGNVTFAATGPSNSIKDFRGQSPGAVFNCVAQQDIPTGTPQNADGSYTLKVSTTANREPLAPGVESWTNCQLRIATSAVLATSDQQFLTLTIPNTANGVAAPTVTLRPSGPGPTRAGTPVRLTARVSPSASGPPPTGTLTFVDTHAGRSAPITGCAGVPLTSTTCTWTPLAGGPHLLTVEYGGDTTYKFTTSAASSYTVTFLTTGVTIISVSPASSTVGRPVTIKAHLAASSPRPAGSVSFDVGGRPIVGCSARPIIAGAAQCVTTFLPAGNDVLTAVYLGDQTYARATSPGRRYHVAPVPVVRIAPTVMLAVTPPSGLQVREYVTLMLVLSGASRVPTGTATFVDNGGAVPGCAGIRVSYGVAFCTTTSLPAGSDRLYGLYSGDAVYLPARSATRTVNVAR